MGGKSQKPIQTGLSKIMETNWEHVMVCPGAQMQQFGPGVGNWNPAFASQWEPE